MKKFISIFLLICCLENSIAQYTVTKVKGTVSNKSTGELLKTGSKLKETDMLSFSSPNDLIRVIVLDKGIFVISPSPNAPKKGNEVIEMLKSTFHLKSKEGYLSGRAEELEAIPDALETDNTVNPKTLISKENKYLFRRTEYNTADGSRFFLQVSSSNAQPLIRPLKTVADTLLLTMDDFSNNHQADPPGTKYNLGYYSKENNTSSSLMEIIPYLDSSNEMEGIIKVILEVSAEKDPVVLKKECYKELYEALGKPNDLVFQKLFQEKLAAKSRKKSN